MVICVLKQMAHGYYMLTPHIAKQQEPSFNKPDRSTESFIYEIIVWRTQLLELLPRLLPGWGAVCMCS